MTRRKKRSQPPPKRQPGDNAGLRTSTTTGPTPWWKRLSVGLVTLVCVPIIVGVTVPIIVQKLPPHADNQGTSSVPTPTVNFDLGTNLCAQLHMDIQCVLSDTGSNSYMSRKSAIKINSVPNCATNPEGFLKWARVNAVGNDNALVLNIASLGHAIVEIENLRISLIKREPPLRTVQMDCAGGAGPNNYVYAIVLLDGNPPKVSYECGGDPCSVPNVTVQPGGNAQFHILAYSNHWLTEWRARINLIVNGRLVTIDLGDYICTPIPVAGKFPDCEPSGSQWACTS
jgi:hypothetical protein